MVGARKSHCEVLYNGNTIATVSVIRALGTVAPLYQATGLNKSISHYLFLNHVIYYEKKNFDRAVASRLVAGL
jgi:hypothetical protein